MEGLRTGSGLEWMPAAGLREAFFILRPFLLLAPSEIVVLHVFDVIRPSQFKGTVKNPDAVSPDS
jgi:hypothetical protein